MELHFPIADVSVSFPLLMFLGFAVGVLSGLFGVGGGFLMTPILFFLGIPKLVATSTEAVQIAGSSVSGVLGHLKRKNVDLKVGSFIAAGGLAGTTAGVMLTRWLRATGQVDTVIEITYVIFLGFIGSLMLIESLSSRSRSQRGVAKRSHTHTFLHRLPWRVKFPRSKLYMSGFLPIGLGFFVGILTALLGVGGGFIMVPAMIYILGMPTLIVIGTSLFTVIFLTASVALQQSLVNVSVDILLALCLMVGGVVGAQVGVRLATRLPAQNLRIWLAILVLAVCAKLAWDLFVYPPAVSSVEVTTLGETL